MFRNVPPNPYHMDATANGFNSSASDVEVRSTVPVSVKITLQVARIDDRDEMSSRPVRTWWKPSHRRTPTWIASCTRNCLCLQEAEWRT